MINEVTDNLLTVTTSGELPGQKACFQVRFQNAHFRNDAILNRFQSIWSHGERIDFFDLSAHLEKFNLNFIDTKQEF